MSRVLSDFCDASRRRLRFAGILAIAITITAPFFPLYASSAWPLKISPDGRHLVDQNGLPLLYTADTSWTMLSMLSVEDARKYIDLRKAQGFNTIQTMATGWRRGGHGPRGVFFEGGDVTRPNERYFDGVDKIVDYARSQDMLLTICLLWLADNGGWSGGTPVQPDQLAQYATWLGNRYRGKGNVVWFLGGDEEISVQTETTKAAAVALAAADPNHLISYHPRSRAFELRFETWLGFNSFQWNANSAPFTYQEVRQGYQLLPAKPILDAEPAYDPTPCCGEDLVTTPHKVRRNAWWAVLSGALGVVYGGPQGTWNIGASGALDWTSVTRPAATHVGNIRKILEPIPWSKLVPDFDGEVVSSGSDVASNHVAAAVAHDGSLIVAYTPVAATLRVALTKLSSPGIAQWFDPASSEAAGPEIPVEPHGARDLTTPGANSDQATDWVLIIRPRPSQPFR